MAKTVLRVRLGATSFYLSTESSSPGTGHRNRYRLFKTDNYGRDELGWIQIGSMAGQELIALDTDQSRFEACEKLFLSKKPHQYWAIRRYTR